MKKLFLILSIFLLLQSCSKPSVETTTEDQIKKVETSLIDAVYLEGDSTWTIEERMKHYGVPGVSIAVIYDNKIAWTKTYGVMDKDTKEPVNTTTLFQAGSISKPVAAYGALKAVESGKINLDEDVNTYLTSWHLPDNEFTKDKKVALKHLLSHTGGVTVHGFPGYSPDLTIPTLVQVLDGLPPANTAPIRVDKVPEESPRYSGGGYCIMQQMLIDVEGKPFPQIMKETVLQPLKMNNSTYDQPLNEPQLKSAATGYLPDGSMTKGKRHTYPEMAAAGLWTTAEDLAKFAIDIQNTLKGESSNVLSQDMAEKMLTPFVADHIGLGIFLDKKKDDQYFGHGGWDEGFSSKLLAHKDKGYGVVVLINSNHPAFIDELQRSVALTYGWGNYVPVYKKLPMDTTRFASIRGRYRNGSDGLVHIYTEGDRLFAKFLRDAKPTEIFQIGKDIYISRSNVQSAQFTTNDGQTTMQFLDENGKPTGRSFPPMKDDEYVPYEYLLAGDFEKSVGAYQALMKADPKDPAIGESNLNGHGYNLLHAGKTELAQALFQVNTVLYPNSANVYDSYAEACFKNGEMELAIENYKKALALNPQNTNAKKMLEELQVE